MSQKSFFLNQSAILSPQRCFTLSISDIIPFMLSFIAAFSTFFPFSGKHRCRRRHEGEEIDEGDACCTERRCMVCLEDVCCDDGNRVSTLAGCHHCFHKDCFEKWLEYSPSCPMCRVPVKRASRKGWLHCLWRFLLACFLRWMDRHFDSDLALVFCNDS